MKITVKVTKTVQEKQYEPFVVGGEIEIDANEKNWEEVFEIAEQNLEEMIDDIIEERLRK